MYNYVVTAHKPSWITNTAVGNFLGPDQRNLLVAKVNYIQVYTITPEGLVCTVVLPIYGTISAMQLMRQPNENQDWLIILTEKYKVCVMKWNAEDGRCHVISSGDTQDHCASGVISERIGVVDPLGRCIALHQCQRLLRIIPTAPEADKNAFNVRLLEDRVLDMVFLYGCTYPTVAILFPVSKDVHQMRAYRISMSEQDIAPSQYQKIDLDPTASKLVAVPPPHCGVLVFCEESIIYISQNSELTSTAIDTTLISAVGQVDSDGSRFLAGDHKGHLMMVRLCRDDSGKCTRINVESLGETSMPKCISYLDSGFVYIGSNSGDSQLIRLSTVPLPETNSYVEVVQTFPNLGPIIDFCIVKGMGYLRQGQGQVVTCSGVGKDGSLRVIRNGIGITEHAWEELPGIKDLFSLRRNLHDRYHRYLLQSFMAETRILELISAEEMAPASLPGLEENSRTLHASNMEGDILVQVTAKGVHVLDCTTMMARPGPVWSPPSDVRISVACGNQKQLLLATTGGNLVLLAVKVEDKTLVEVGHLEMSNEIACVNCNVLQTNESEMTDSDSLAGGSEAIVAAVGLWAEVKESPVVQLVALPSLKIIHTVKLGGDTIARGVLLATLEKHHYLVVALGDGYLLTYSLNVNALASAVERMLSSSGNNIVESMTGSVDAVGCDVDADGDGDGDGDGGDDDGDDDGGDDGAEESVKDGAGCEMVSERRKLSVGTKPADLSIFKSKGSDHIFAACDRPTVVYSATGGGKLLVSNVNLQEVTRVCGFDTQAFPDCLAIATDTGLHLGAVDEIQKLHITSVPLDEQPRRIAHLDSHRVFAVTTERPVLDERGDEMLEHYIRIVDDTRYDTLNRYRLNCMEIGSSVLTTTFSGENMDRDEQFLVVGTAVELPNEEDPKDGRVLVFRISSSGCILVAEHQAHGAVYSMVAYNGMLVAGIGPEVRVLSICERKDGSLGIKEEDRHSGHILAYKLCVRGDLILVGDLLKSVNLLTVKKAGNSVRLEEVARDNDVVWVMALEMLDDDMFIIAEHSKHLYTYRRKARSATETERSRLERVGQFHLGTRVNRIQHGSLVMQMTDGSDGPALSTLIFGTIDGMLGVIARLKPEVYSFFHEVENAMATLIPGVGGLKHAEWREMVHINPPRIAPARNFVDGDLIERFLDLNSAQMAKVSSMVNVGVEELVQRVEEIMRLHGAG